MITFKQLLSESSTVKVKNHVDNVDIMDDFITSNFLRVSGNAADGIEDRIENGMSALTVIVENNESYSFTQVGSKVGCVVDGGGTYISKASTTPQALKGLIQKLPFAKGLNKEEAAEKAYYFVVLHNNNKRHAASEKIILRHGYWISNYARNVLKRRWPEGEKTVLKNGEHAAKYAEEVIKGRWPEAEKVIMKHPEGASEYAINVLKRRWPEAEAAIAKSDVGLGMYKRAYEKTFNVKL